jgi:hypothetical protein
MLRLNGFSVHLRSRRITRVAGRQQARRYPEPLSRSMVEHWCMMVDLVATDPERVTQCRFSGV